MPLWIRHWYLYVLCVSGVWVWCVCVCMRAFIGRSDARTRFPWRRGRVGRGRTGHQGATRYRVGSPPPVEIRGINLVTRMHSGRIRTSLLSTASRSIPCIWGWVYLEVGGLHSINAQSPRCRSPLEADPPGCRLSPGCRPLLEADPLDTYLPIKADPPGCRSTLDADPSRKTGAG